MESQATPRQPANGSVKRPWYRRDGLTRDVLMGIAVLAISGIWLVLRPASFRIDFGEVTERSDAEILLHLRQEFMATRNWRPWNMLPDADRKKCQEHWKTVLANIILRDPQAADWPDLYREVPVQETEVAAESEGELPNSSSELLRKVDIYNSLIGFLWKNNAGDLSSLRHGLKSGGTGGQPRNNELLEEYFNRALSNWRHDQYASLMKDTEASALLTRLDCPPFPSGQTLSQRLRRTAKAMLKKRDDDQDRWVRNYCVASQHDLMRLSNFYHILNRDSRLEFRAPQRDRGQAEATSQHIPSFRLVAEIGGSELSIKRKGSDLSTTANAVLVLEADETPSPHALASRRQSDVPGDSQPQSESVTDLPRGAVDDHDKVVRSYDTGIRCNNLKLIPIGSASTLNATVRKDEARTNLGITVKYEWPPESCFVDAVVLVRMLHDLGLARQFRVANASAAPTEEDKREAIRLSCRIVHPDVTGFRYDLSFVWGTEDLEGSIQELKSELRGLVSSPSFDEAVTQMPRLRGVPVQISHSQDAGTSWKCQLAYPFGKLSLDLVISANGEFRLVGRPTQTECRSIAERLFSLKPEFGELVHLVVIDNCEVDMVSANLSGTLSILGSAIDAATDLRRVRWSIRRADAVPQVDFTRDELVYLRGITKRLDQLPNADPDDVKSVVKHVAEYLEHVYPALLGLVDVMPLERRDGAPTNLILLRLQIGDWPEVCLGPKKLTVDNIKSVIDELLSPENVRQQATEQWEAARTRVSLFGVECSMTGWNPGKSDEGDQRRTPEATISSTIQFPIGGAQNPQASRITLAQWREVVVARRNVGGDLRRWQRFVVDRDNVRRQFSEDQLCRQLTSTLEETERLLSDTLSTVFQRSCKVTVERDGFGIGRWLSVNPPAVRIALELDIPLLPVSVRAGQILIDQTDPFVHYPEEWTVRYLRTFYTPKLNISDPMIRVNFRHKSLTLGCKITPPLPPLLKPLGGNKPGKSSDQLKATADAWLRKSGLQISSFTLRPDNAWLHIVYLETELGVRLKDPAVSAKGHIQVLEFHRAASADLTVALAEPSVSANLTAEGSSFAEFPITFSGGMKLDRTGMTMDTKYNIVGASLEGLMRYDLETSEAPIRIDGRIQLPLIGKADAHCKSNLSLTNVYVSSEGKARAPRVLGRNSSLLYRFRAHHKIADDGSPVGGYHLYIAVIDSKGNTIASVNRVGNSVRRLDEEDILDALQGSGKGTSEKEDARTRQPSPLTPPELPYVALLPSGPEYLERPAPSAERPPSPFVDIDSKGRIVRSARSYPIKSADSGSMPNSYDLMDAHGMPVATFQLPFLTKSESTRASVWKRSDGAIHLLVHDAAQKQTVVLRFLEKKVDNRKTLDGDFSSETGFSPYEGTAAEREASTSAVISYVSRMICDADPQLPAAAPGGYLIRWKGPGDTTGERQAASYAWARSDGEYMVYRFRSSGVPTSLWFDDSVLARLRQSRERSGTWIVGIDRTLGRTAFLRPHSFNKDRIVFQLSDPESDGPASTRSHIDVTLLADLSHDRRLSAAEVVAAYMLSKVDLEEPLLVYASAAGVAVCTESKKRVGFFRFDHDDGFWFVDGPQFINWNIVDSRNHLPKRLQSRDQRKQAWESDHEALVSEFLIPWSQLRHKEIWGANPLGLLEGLMRRSSSAR